MKRIIYLAVAALVALMILAPAAMAQGTQPQVTQKVQATVEKTTEGPLPSSGGPVVGSVLLPAAALLVGSGVLAYAVIRRR